jgi:short-subunit dehydrogenase
MGADSTTRPRALVTGASSGIGMAFAGRLARDGYDLAIVARRRERLDDLAQRLRRDHGVGVGVLVADLTQPDDLRTVERHLAADPVLELLVNNACFAGYMPFSELEPDRAEELIRLHVLATTRLARAALPGMLARGRGSIVNVASMLAYSAPVPASSPLPRRVVYAACKAYIVAFSELLSHEVEGSGVRVQALCPGLVGGTEFHDHVPGFDPARRAAGRQQPEGVVAASLAGLRLGEVLCMPGLDDVALLDRLRETERAVAEARRFAEALDRVSACTVPP